VTMTLLVLIRAHTSQHLTLGLLSAGIGLMALSDSLFAYLTAISAYRTGSMIDVGWLIAFLLFGLAAMSSNTAATFDGQAVEVPGRGRLWLPYVPLLLAGAVGLHRTLPGLKSGPVPAVALLLVLVVLIRQFITVAENRRLLVTVAHQAFHDPLTGLANRALFTDRLDHAVHLQQRDQRPLAVLCLDLDDFKLVNDSLGHAAGDGLLVRVAERLIGCLRGSDTVARVGGDEFAVLIDDGGDSPLAVAERLVEAFGAPFMIDGHALSVRPSVGLATASAVADGVSAESLLKQADLAMYAAKRRGAGGVEMFQPDMYVAKPDGSSQEDPVMTVARRAIDVG
jgi:diguanylate cyclase